MPARITIKAELQNLLNKAQALTDANRLSQLEGERRRRAEREQLAAKKVKAEEEERRRRAPDDPTMRNIRTAAMGQQQSGPAFALIPTVPIDFSLKGPYGESPSESEFLLEKQAGIYGLSRGYANTLWGVNRGDWITHPIPVTDLPSPLLEPDGGLYGPKVTENSLVGVLDETGYFEVPRTYEGGGFNIRHLIAEGTDIRWYRSGTLFLADNSVPVGVSNLSDSGTLESLVRVGAAAPFSGSGQSRALFRLVSTEEDQSSTEYTIVLQSSETGCNYIGRFVTRENTVTIEQGSFPSNLGGQLIHVAVVQRKTQFSVYIAGVRVHVFNQAVHPPSRKRAMEIWVSISDEAQQLAYFNINETYNGPSLFKSIRYTSRALYSGDSFTPPTSITALA